MEVDACDERLSLERNEELEGEAVVLVLVVMDAHDDLAEVLCDTSSKGGAVDGNIS